MHQRKREQILPGKYHQNELPFTQQKVTPGVGLKANEDGKHGFHSMYRTRELTVDDLRIKPKITYEGRTVDGMKGQMRPIQAPVMTYKPETFKETSSKDLLPTDNLADGPKTRDKFIMRDPHRANQHIEYTGGAYTSHEAVGKNVPEHMREKLKYSQRQNLYFQNHYKNMLDKKSNKILIYLPTICHLIIVHKILLINILV